MEFSSLLALHSRRGDKTRGIRGRFLYMYSAVLKGLYDHYFHRKYRYTHHLPRVRCDRSSNEEVYLLLWLYLHVVASFEAKEILYQVHRFCSRKRYDVGPSCALCMSRCSVCFVFSHHAHGCCLSVGPVV